MITKFLIEISLETIAHKTDSFPLELVFTPKSNTPQSNE